MPTPLHVVKQIPGALAQPLGMAKQITLNDAGQRIPNYRLTQDLSFSISQKNCSVNDRIDMDQYNEMIYGWCLSRIIHYVVALRSRFPTDRVLMSKYDYSDAYRRIAHSASASTQSIYVFKDIAYVALRLTFGGSPNPPTWCLFSEMVTDLANQLYMCPDWNPDQFRSPGQPITPTPKLDSGDEPFGQALPTAITVPTSPTAKTDGFIDDLITVFRDTTQNRERAPHTVPLVMHVTRRPHTGPDELVTHQSILADHKSITEGSLCGMPQAIWLRRFGNVTGPAPCTSRAATTCSQISEPYSRHTTTSTPPQNDKKPSPPNCCESCSIPAEPIRPNYKTRPKPLPQTSSLAPFSFQSEHTNTQPLQTRKDQTDCPERSRFPIGPKGQPKSSRQGFGHRSRIRHHHLCGPKEWEQNGHPDATKDGSRIPLSRASIRLNRSADPSQHPRRGTQHQDQLHLLPFP
jgi:hypothetical protein